jgi:hypothetical protein
MMPIRLRKLIGAIALIILVVTWALIAMALAQAPAIRANGMLEVIYYVVAGLGWILPAMPLIAWMSRPDVRRSFNRARWWPWTWRPHPCA